MFFDHANMIEEYKFGKIIISGKNYNDDVSVDWNGEVSEWDKSDSHLIGIDDVKAALEKKPEVIVVGTGRDGMAEMTEEAQSFILGKGVKLMIDKTEEAVKTFNILKENSIEEEGRQAKVIGLFHLTC